MRAEEQARSLLPKQSRMDKCSQDGACRLDPEKEQCSYVGHDADTRVSRQYTSVISTIFPCPNPVVGKIGGSSFPNVINRLKLKACTIYTYPSSASQSNHVVQVYRKSSLPTHHDHLASDRRISLLCYHISQQPNHHLFGRSKTTSEDETPQVPSHALSSIAQATFSARRRRFTSFSRADKTRRSKKSLHTN